MEVQVEVSPPVTSAPRHGCHCTVYNYSFYRNLYLLCCLPLLMNEQNVQAPVPSISIGSKDSIDIHVLIPRPHMVAGENQLPEIVP